MNKFDAFDAAHKREAETQMVAFFMARAVGEALVRGVSEQKVLRELLDDDSARLLPAGVVERLRVKAGLSRTPTAKPVAKPTITLTREQAAAEAQYRAAEQEVRGAQEMERMARANMDEAKKALIDATGKMALARLAAERAAEVFAVAEAAVERADRNAA